MRKIKLMITAGVTVLALSTVPVASAQYSLSSFSSSDSAPAEETPALMPDPEEETPAPDAVSDEARLKELHDRLLQNMGLTENEASTEVAEDLANRVLAGELSFADDQAEVNEFPFYSLVQRFTASEVALLFAAIDAGYQPDFTVDEAFDDLPLEIHYGTAGGSDDEDVYLVSTISWGDIQ